jgi:WD40 repeat protein
VTEVKPEPLELKPGDRLSPLSLVVNPAKLDGALSWTLETRRHRGEILTMALSHDGKLVATGGDDGTIRIWLLETGTLVRALVGHMMYVSGLAWSPDGQTIASSGGYDCQLRLWDSSTGKPLRVFQGFKEYTRQIAWSPDGGRLAVVGGSSGWIWMWDAKGEQGRMVAEIGKSVTTMDWSPGGDQLAFTVNDGPASIVDAASGKVVQTFGEASTTHHRACWSPDGTKFLVTSADKSVVYKMPEAKPLATLPKAGWGPAWSPDSKSVYVMSPEGPRLWDLVADKVVQKIDRSGWPWFILDWKQPDRLVAVSKTTMVWWDPRV